MQHTSSTSRSATSAVAAVAVMEGNEDLVLAETDCEVQYEVLLHDLEDPGAPGDPRDLWDAIDYPELPADPLADPAPSEPIYITPVDPCLIVPEANPEAIPGPEVAIPLPPTDRTFPSKTELKAFIDEFTEQHEYALVTKSLRRYDQDGEIKVRYLQCDRSRS
ncbi:uncharacterized protein KD926_010161 [Aspergillus affinis]|uniref:uncharacterized protein n=1 Tax=Aspergillus affinis TaxID=1070780 RepID=UPI0022FE2B2A|nr:uncharacterized protein KD926_010161 [Aspergillus affinis]KAI9038828.1 hypothetical protein KD926_010161 [Aspergillus affinis]